jgi:hypothetical protein
VEVAFTERSLAVIIRAAFPNSAFLYTASSNFRGISLGLKEKLAIPEY